MQFLPTPIEGLFEVTSTVLEDDRGWFIRTYDTAEFRSIHHHQPWIQCNHSFTNKMGTVRGLHFQYPPYAEIKLVRCVQGTVWDVAVDLRKGSPTFLKWHAVELSAGNRKSFYIPEGCAHGFQCLTDGCGLTYMHSQLYHANAEAGLRWDDPAIAISWPLPPGSLSARDENHPLITPTFDGLTI